MNKQIVSNTNSAGNLLEAGSATKSNLSSTSIPRKYKMVLTVAGVIVVAVAVCAAIAVAVGTSQSLKNKIHTQQSENGINNEEDLLDIDMEESQQLSMDVSTHTCDLFCSSLAITQSSLSSCVYNAKFTLDFSLGC